MVTPVFSLSELALKYEALCASSVAVSYSFSGNFMIWPTTQVGRSTATRMRNAPSPASMSPMMPRIVPPDDPNEIQVTLLEHVLFWKLSAEVVVGPPRGGRRS